MSRQVRHRVTAVVLGGLLLGTPLLTNGTASAEQVQDGRRQVVFDGGGVLGLSCRSTPNVGSMTVPTDSTVRVVNQTGYSARLQLGGTTKGTVPDHGSTEVVFRRGTTAVLLSPSCALRGESVPVLVTATPSTPSTTMPDPIPAPTDGNAAPASPSGSGSPSASNGGSTMPDAVTSPSRPPRTSAGTSRPALTPTASRAQSAAAATAVQTMPQGGSGAATAMQTMAQGGSGARIKTRITRGTAAAGPAFSGMPPGDKKAIVGGVPTVGLSEATGTTLAAPAAPPSDVAAAEPVAAIRPMSEPSSLGLLALIASVCVLGVAVATIRAIVSQRASRTTIA
jgi:hypothetical protein